MTVVVIRLLVHSELDFLTSKTIQNQIEIGKILAESKNLLPLGIFWGPSVQKILDWVGSCCLLLEHSKIENFYSGFFLSFLSSEIKKSKSRNVERQERNAKFCNSCGKGPVEKIFLSHLFPSWHTAKQASFGNGEWFSMNHFGPIFHGLTGPVIDHYIPWETWKAKMTKNQWRNITDKPISTQNLFKKSIFEF